MTEFGKDGWLIQGSARNEEEVASINNGQDAVMP